MTAYLVCVGAAAAGIAYLYRLALPPAPALARDVRAWRRGRAAATRRAASIAPPTRGARWTAAGLGVLESRSPELVRRLDQDLAVVGESRERWLIRTVVGALVLLLGLPLATPLVMSLGSPVASGATLLVTGSALACLIVVLRLRELRQRASRRREEFRRGLSLYLDLVVMSMEAGRGHAESLPTVAGIGTGWVFDELRSAVASARAHGITAWAALGRVGNRLGIVELIDLEASIELAQDEGGRVRDSLVARATSMRAARAVDLQARAAAKTEAMRNTLVVMALLTAAYVITARILYLLSA